MGAFDLDFEDDVVTTAKKPVPNYKPSNFRYNKKTAVANAKPAQDYPRTVPAPPKNRTIDTNSPEWMRECFARYVACMPLGKSLAFIQSYENQRGKPAAKRLEADVRAIELKGYLDDADLAY